MIILSVLALLLVAKLQVTCKANNTKIKPTESIVGGNTVTDAAEVPWEHEQNGNQSE